MNLASVSKLWSAAREHLRRRRAKAAARREIHELARCVELLSAAAIEAASTGSVNLAAAYRSRARLHARCAMTLAQAVHS